MKRFRKLLGILTSLVLTITPLIAGAFSATAYEQAYLQSGKIYRIKYKDSGKYLTVCNGLDADGVNIIQKDLDGTLSQQFRVVYDSASDAYRIYAMCSSNGNGRVLQIYAPLGVEAGCNVELKSQSDTDLQLWKVDFYYGVRADLCYIFTKNSNKILTATAGNGSQYGTAPESAGNVWIKDYVDDNQSGWCFEIVNPSADPEPGNYYIRNKSTNDYLYVNNNSVDLGAAASKEKWQVIYIGNGVYNLRPNSQPSSVVCGDFGANGELMMGSSALSLFIIPDGEGSYRIVTASSYISTLTVSEGIATRGTYQALDTQRWIFEPA